jgi:hypothetical protein
MATKPNADPNRAQPGYRRLLLQPSPIIRRRKGKLVVSDAEPHFVWLPEPPPTEATLLRMRCPPTLQ